jgi:dihydrofolate synthase
LARPFGPLNVRADFCARYFQTSRPATLPITGIRRPTPAQAKNPRGKKGKSGNRHWTEKIGTTYDRVRRRLVTEDLHWRERLARDNKDHWKSYIKDWREKGGEIGVNFGQTQTWTGRKRRGVWSEEHASIIKLWKEGGRKGQEGEQKNRAIERAGLATEPPTILQFMEAAKEKEPLGPIQLRAAPRTTVRNDLKPDSRFGSERKTVQPPRNQFPQHAGVQTETKEDCLERLASTGKKEGMDLGKGEPLPLRTAENSKERPTEDTTIDSSRTRKVSPQMSAFVTRSMPARPQSERPIFRLSSSHLTERRTTTAIEPPPITLGLKKITKLLDKLGNPQDNLKVVHIAGTNGKGSVCAYLTSCLVASNLKVGQFTSPHLIDRWDCITINGTPISKEDFLNIEQSVKEISDRHAIDASSFEILTACAVTYFSKKKIDVGVIEAGMGGLLDATNVFKSPLASVITPISIDHTQYLGSTIKDIARHKAGIIKPRSAVVSADQQMEALMVLQQTAIEAESHLHIASGHWRTPAQTRFMVKDVRFQDFDQLSAPVLGVVPGIAGAQQSSNIACAVKTLDILRIWFPQISEGAVQSGVASANVPGRMEWVRFELPEGRVPMLLDGAHNPSSCKALAEFIGGLRREAPVIWVVSFSRGRNIEECLGKLVKVGDSVACVEFGDVDGMGWVKPVDAKDIATYAEKMTGSSERVMNFKGDVRAAIKWAVKETKQRRGILVGTGSLYLVGEVHRLRRDDPEFT